MEQMDVHFLPRKGIKVSPNSSIKNHTPAQLIEFLTAFNSRDFNITLRFFHNIIRSLTGDVPESDNADRKRKHKSYAAPKPVN